MKLSLSLQFWAWIVGGIIIAWIGLYGLDQYCNATATLSEKATDRGGAKAQQHSHLGNQPAPLRLLAYEEKEPRAQRQDASENENKKSWSRSVLCDLKITDIAIAFFTYCLAVVGWFTIRSNEQTVMNLERALLAVGPTQITRYATPPKVTLKLNVHNTGRTSATIFEVCGQFSRAPPVGDKPDYTRGVAVITDLSVASGADSVLDPFLFEDNFDGDQFFWGYLRYRDIFKIVHTARVCVAIFPRLGAGGTTGKYQLAGSDAWRECD
jgi:hypothetical protein